MPKNCTTDVWPGGPADRAGLKAGDLILTLDGDAVNDEASLNYHVLTRNSGDAVTLQFSPERTVALIEA